MKRIGMIVGRKNLKKEKTMTENNHGRHGRPTSTELDLCEQDERDGGEHKRRDELEGGRGLGRTEQTRAEEIGGQDDREVDERHERAEKRTEQQYLHGGREC